MLHLRRTLPWWPEHREVGTARELPISPEVYRRLVNFD
jgi:hypothetical protein